MSPQAFIELTIDQELSTAEMRILGSDLEPFQFAEFEPPYFSNGDLNGDVVLFRDTIFGTSLFGFPLEGELEYDVVLDGDLISLQGELVWDPGCFDCPYILYHTGVEASVVPEPATAILLALGVAILMLRFGWQGLYFPPRKWRCSR
ncbi:MAG: PEP-CTERM sorting domain-containing protein [Planctomycetes bacterium]|nr:PEP-CTERM sorting domain-containing protein [Planctomycetota bacterium]